MKRQGAEVAVAGMGENFSLADERTYVLNPREKDHYRTLLADLAGSGALPRTIVHAWNLTPAASQPASVASWEEARVRGFDSLVFLVQALESMNSKEAINITVLSSNMQKVGGEPVLQPEKAILLGPVKVIPQEHPDIRCRSIDLVLPEFDGATEDLIDDLLADLAVFESNEIAYRGRERWARLFGPVRLGPEIRPNPRLREKGVYLITGGLGGIGLAFAEKLAREAQARLILTARSAFPAKDEWEEWVAVRGEQDERAQIIRKLQAMEEAGARVAVIPADVADMDAMRSALQKAEDHFGEISGVIHAAGVPGGELSGLVLRPKVQGALVLQSLLKDRRLDFFLLCSSINSIIGGFGQSDYCAANAFFDAFAQANFSSDVGMAARPFSSGYSGLPRFLDMTATTAPGPGHMLLGEMITETHEKEVHAASFSPERHWVLSEHRIAGSPVVPGTTYLEMARAVFARHARGNPVSIHQTVFSAPLVVKEGETKNVLTVLEKKSESFLFRVLSKADEDGQPAALWEEHARGDIANGDGKGRERFDLVKLLRDFEENGRVVGHGADHTEGPRAMARTTLSAGNSLRPVRDGTFSGTSTSWAARASPSWNWMNALPKTWPITGCIPRSWMWPPASFISSLTAIFCR